MSALSCVLLEDTSEPTFLCTLFNVKHSQKSLRIWKPSVNYYLNSSLALLTKVNNNFQQKFNKNFCVQAKVSFFLNFFLSRKAISLKYHLITSTAKLVGMLKIMKLSFFVCTAASTSL
jgi:hypothetical protein